MELGHMDYNVRRALEEGLDPIDAITMATLNTAEHFRVDTEIGGIAPGKRADIILTPDITKMRAEPNLTSKVVLVLKKGRKVEKLGESGEFVRVKLSWGDSGWVLNRLLEPAP
jgi:adenine deaminase